MCNRKNLAQGIRAGGAVSSYDRHGNVILIPSSLKLLLTRFLFLIWHQQNTLSKGYYVNPNGKAFKAGSLQSPTHSYSSSEGGNYAIMDNRIKMDRTSPNEINNHNRYSAPLNYHDSQNGSGGVMNNRRSAPEFLTDNS